MSTLPAIPAQVPSRKSQAPFLQNHPNLQPPQHVPVARVAIAPRGLVSPYVTLGFRPKSLADDSSGHHVMQLCLSGATARKSPIGNPASDKNRAERNAASPIFPDNFHDAKNANRAKTP